MTNPNESPDSVKQLLQSSLATVFAEPEHDLWPRMLQRLDEQPQGIPVLDWVLGAALVAMLVVSPAAIPILLYQL